MLRARCDVPGAGARDRRAPLEAEPGQNQESQTRPLPGKFILARQNATGKPASTMVRRQPSPLARKAREGQARPWDARSLSQRDGFSGNFAAALPSWSGYRSGLEATLPEHRLSLSAQDQLREGRRAVVLPGRRDNP